MNLRSLLQIAKHYSLIVSLRDGRRSLEGTPSCPHLLMRFWRLVCYSSCCPSVCLWITQMHYHGSLLRPSLPMNSVVDWDSCFHCGFLSEARSVIFWALRSWSTYFPTFARGAGCSLEGRTIRCR